MHGYLLLVLSIPPRLAVAAANGQLKGASSHDINQRYLNGMFAWQAEYCIFSISESALEKVVGYVTMQKQHLAERILIEQLEATSN